MAGWLEVIQPTQPCSEQGRLQLDQPAQSLTWGRAACPVRRSVVLLLSSPGQAPAFLEHCSVAAVGAMQGWLLAAGTSALPWMW